MRDAPPPVNARPPGRLAGALRPDKSPNLRLRQGLALLLGGVAVELLLGLGPIDFLATPFALGVAYTAAAALGGRRGGYWATAVVLLGFGLAVLVLNAATPDTPLAVDYALGSIFGILTGLALIHLGFAVGVGALVATALGAGGIFALEGLVSGPFGQDHIYAAALALVGAFNIALATASHRRRGDVQPRTGSSTTPPSSGGESRTA